MKRTSPKISVQIKRAVAKPVIKKKKEYDGDTRVMISTGSTLLDLAISGGRVKGGGIPGGIVVEIFGPSSAGKTVLLCEIAGAVQRQGGSIMFNDPEARLNKQFARMFDLNPDEMDYDTPDTVTGVFQAVRKWKPPVSDNIHGIFTDSLAALSTDLEMDNEEGDKMGMRRAKEFSEEFRRTARMITKNNYLLVCSNQVRENSDAGKYEVKVKSTGGHAIGFYSSLRLRASNPSKIFLEKTVAGKKVKKVIGVQTTFEVFKSSVWKPYRTAPLTILFDYGIDDVRENLQYLKDYTGASTYVVGGEKLDVSMEKSIRMVEENGWEDALKQEVTELWMEIEEKFSSERKPKNR